MGLSATRNQFFIATYNPLIDTPNEGVLLLRQMSFKPVDVLSLCVIKEIRCRLIYSKEVVSAQPLNQLNIKIIHVHENLRAA